MAEEAAEYLIQTRLSSPLAIHNFSEVSWTIWNPFTLKLSLTLIQKLSNELLPESNIRRLLSLVLNLRCWYFGVTRQRVQLLQCSLARMPLRVSSREDALQRWKRAIRKVYSFTFVDLFYIFIPFCFVINPIHVITGHNWETLHPNSEIWELLEWLCSPTCVQCVLGCKYGTSQLSWSQQ